MTEPDYLDPVGTHEGINYDRSREAELREKAKKETNAMKKTSRVKKRHKSYGSHWGDLRNAIYRDLQDASHTITELAKMHDRTPHAISTHITKLLDEGLIEPVRRGSGKGQPYKATIKPSNSPATRVNCHNCSHLSVCKLFEIVEKLNESSKWFSNGDLARICKHYYKKNKRL